MREEKKKKRAGAVLCLAAVAVILLAGGCGRRKEGDHVLRLSLDSEVSTLDAQAAFDSASLEVIGSIMEGLYVMDEEEQPVLAAAEREEVSSDGRIHRFYLKERKWSDGSPVTAMDFVYGFRRAADPSLANENAFLLDVAGIAGAEEVCQGKAPLESLGICAVDEKTVEITLERPVPYFSSMMAFPLFFPAKEEFVKKWGGEYAQTPEKLLSNGPYMMESYDPSALSFTLKKNPCYQGQEGKVEKIRYQVIKDSQQALLAYKNGDLDIAPLNGDQAEQLRDDKEFHSFLLGSLWYISPNQKVKGLENKNLRRALAVSFDKKAITEQIMKDGSFPAGFAVPYGLGKGPEGMDFRENKKEYLSYNKEEAGKYWKEAKKELGLSEKEGLTFTLLTEDTDAASLIGQYLQSQIQENLPGITIKLEKVPKKVRLSRMKEGDYDLGLVRWGGDYGDPAAFLQMWTSDSPYNYGSWSDRGYDEKIAFAVQGFTAGEEEKRWEALAEGEKMVMDDAVIFPVCQKANAFMIKSNVSGMEFHPVGINRIFWNIEKDSQ